MTDLPTTSFTELALDLHLVATQGARQVGAMEGQAMALARAGEHESGEDRLSLWRVYETGLLEARQTAMAAADAHHVLKALAPYEAEIRAMLARNERSAAA